MAKDEDIVRPAGLLERFHITRHFVGLDSCVLCAAQYIIPEHRTLDRPLLFSALRKVVQLHAALGVRVVGEASQVQSFVRLKAVDLSKVVEFSESDDLKIAFEAQFQRPFNTAANLPLWRVVVLTNNIVCFAWHHCIGDGLSRLAFHRALLTSLQEIEVTDDITDVHPPTTMTLIPAVDTIMNLSPSWRAFLRTIYDVFAPTSWTRGASAWTGKAVPVDATLKTHVRIIDVPPQDVAAFLTLCRTNNTSLTGALYTLAVSVLSVLILSSQNVTLKTISCSIPISLRGVAGISQDVFGEYLTTLDSYSPFQPEFSWATASKFTTALRSYPKSGEKIGMLKYLYGNYVGYFRGKLGNKRQGGLELSNLGVFSAGDTPAGYGGWSIEKMAFAQCDSVVGAALKINVVGNPMGGMAITVTWGECSIENSMAESFVSGLEYGFRELLMRQQI